MLRASMIAVQGMPPVFGVVLGLIPDRLSGVLEVPYAPGVVRNPVIHTKRQIRRRLDRTTGQACHVCMGDQGSEVPCRRWTARIIEAAHTKAEHRESTCLGEVTRR